MAISAPELLIIEDIKKEQMEAPEIQFLKDSKLPAEWTKVDGIYFYKGKIYIPQHASLKFVILEEFHHSPVGGHEGVHKTYVRTSATFFWKNMRRDVAEFVKNCVTCQQVKAINTSPYGLLQPLEVPKNVWEEVSLDFITHLPNSQGFTFILVIVDRFSKSAHFGALPTHYTALKVAQLFMDIVGKLHGLPKSIVSDRDAIFLSKFWQELFTLQGTTLKMSSSYHPQTDGQTDGQTEVVNKCLQQYLRCFISEEPNSWHKFLGLAEWCYNTSFHSTIGQNPYEVVYGRAPPSLA